MLGRRTPRSPRPESNPDSNRSVTNTNEGIKMGAPSASPKKPPEEAIRKPARKLTIDESKVKPAKKEDLNRRAINKHKSNRRRARSRSAGGTEYSSPVRRPDKGSWFCSCCWFWFKISN